jgi:hypothetical protein
MLYQLTREESRTKTSKWEETYQLACEQALWIEFQREFQESLFAGYLPAGYEELDQSKPNQKWNKINFKKKKK